MAKISNKEILEIAKNEATDSDTLKYIWETSRSSKVRKAIAMNPNADATTLRAAARLYLEEVLENPAFEMLELFGDDSWINCISKIYASPTTWMIESRRFYRIDSRYESFAKAAIISPNCNSDVLCAAMEFLSVTALKRTFKHPITRDKAKRIMIKELEETPRCFTMEGLFKAYNAGLISEEELYFHVKAITIIGARSCRKSTYTKTFRTLLAKAETNTRGAGAALSAILLCSRSSCVSWVSYDIKKHHLTYVADAIISAKKIANKSKGKQIHPSIKQGLSWVEKSLAGIVVDVLWNPLSFEQRLRGIETFYNDVVKLGLADHEWGNSKETAHPMMINKEIAEELLRKPIEMKTFYAKNKCLGSWFHMQKSDAKFQIVEEVNEHLYKTKGIEHILYNEVNLQKIIRISPDVFFN